MAVFEYLRLSLSKPDQLSLLGSDDQPARDVSRREYLERIFSQLRWDFSYRGSNYTFLNDGIYSDTLVGRIGKQVVEPIHRGPEQGYIVDFVEGWKPVWMLLDLSSDSQLISLQTGLASSRNLLRALFDQIETRTTAREYDAFVEYVADRQEFWRAVERYEGRLTRLEFSFVPPNALGLEETIRSIVDAGKDLGSKTTKFVHINTEGGLHPQGEYVAAALEKTSEGAGSVVLKAGRKTVYSSSRNRRTADVPKDDLPSQKNESEISSLVSRLLGK